MSKYTLKQLGFRPRPKKDLRSLFAARPDKPPPHEAQLPTNIHDGQPKPLPRFASEFFSKLENFGNMDELKQIAGSLPPLE